MTRYYLPLCTAIAISLTACGMLGSLTSQTLIQAHNSFVLGDNAHGSFRAKLTNTSNHDLKVFQTPIAGGSHSPVWVHPQQTVRVQVDRDTALRIENPSDETVAIDLVVHGDTGLSMGYQQ